MNYDDASLTATTIDRGSPGYARAAVALLTITGDDREKVRALLDAEAHIRNNVQGGIYSYTVEAVVRDWHAGCRDMPYTEGNRAMLARERAERARTGVYRPEPFGRTWGRR